MLFLGACTNNQKVKQKTDGNMVLSSIGEWKTTIVIDSNGNDVTKENLRLI